MINQENNITVGHRAKERFRAAVNSFILDCRNRKKWDIGDVQHLRGLLNYYKMVEPEYFDNVISRMDKKYHVDTMKMFKYYLNGTL